MVVSRYGFARINAHAQFDWPYGNGSSPTDPCTSKSCGTRNCLRVEKPEDRNSKDERSDIVNLLNEAEARLGVLTAPKLDEQVKEHLIKMKGKELLLRATSRVTLSSGMTKALLWQLDENNHSSRHWSVNEILIGCDISPGCSGCAWKCIASYGQAGRFQCSCAHAQLYILL